MQALGEVTDPLNYSPYWFREALGDAEPVHVLLTEGLHDEQTPYQTTEALAAAAGVPFWGAVPFDPLLEEALGDPLALEGTEAFAAVAAAVRQQMAGNGSS